MTSKLSHSLININIRKFKYKIHKAQSISSNTWNDIKTRCLKPLAESSSGPSTTAQVLTTLRHDALDLYWIQTHFPCYLLLLSFLLSSPLLVFFGFPCPQLLSALPLVHSIVLFFSRHLYTTPYLLYVITSIPSYHLHNSTIVLATCSPPRFS